jgi:hypothetical protein
MAEASRGLEKENRAPASVKPLIPAGMASFRDMVFQLAVSRGQKGRGRHFKLLIPAYGRLHSLRIDRRITERAHTTLTRI